MDILYRSINKKKHIQYIEMCKRLASKLLLEIDIFIMRETNYILYKDVEIAIIINGENEREFDKILN